MDMIQIENKGAEIVSSNYWNTENNLKGLFFCSINAGAFRLLVDSRTNGELIEPMLEAARNASEIVISRGFWTEHNKRDCFEFLFDDHPDTPYCINIFPEQADRLPSEGDEGRKFRFLVYDAGKMVFDGKCMYRRVKRLPCLKSFSQTGGREN